MHPVGALELLVLVLEVVVVLGVLLVVDVLVLVVLLEPTTVVVVPVSMWLDWLLEDST